MTTQKDNLGKTSDEKYVSKPDMEKRLSISDTTASKLIEAGQFPGAFKVGDGKAARWRIPASEIDAYILRRRAGNPVAMRATAAAA